MKAFIRKTMIMPMTVTMPIARIAKGSIIGHNSRIEEKGDSACRRKDDETTKAV